ncbi:MAG TPA: thioredoxin [Candidatus Avacidaminococcus intestinavium]|uniref:Thioredoxin n=1 Tax=Candidatus Avacidaminococcus intestinavium TaxID=2840684 RepID=A0A9D1SLA8_9FIRM|nr:thioredoxin [Candidatus Avacidaminococcus intestinavium]
MALVYINNSEEFKKEILASDKVVLVDFWAPWCGPCRMIGPVIEEMAEEVGDSAVIAKVNVDDVGDVASEYGVMSIPTLIYFKDGKEVKRIVGVRPKDELVKELNAIK